MLGSRDPWCAPFTEVATEAHEVRELAQGLSMASWDCNVGLCGPEPRSSFQGKPSAG